MYLNCETKQAYCARFLFLTESLEQFTENFMIYEVKTSLFLLALNNKKNEKYLLTLLS